MNKPEVILLFDDLLNKYGNGLRVSDLFDRKILVELDNGFRKVFAGKYYRGLPVNYILHRGSVGWEIHAPEALTVALGERATLCTGVLERFMSFGGTESAIRSWVEVCSGYVLEPAWGLAIEKDLYYKVFRPKIWEKQTYKQLVAANQQDPAAINIYCREDYENNGIPLNPNVVREAQVDANIIKQSSYDNPQRCAEAEQLLAALPDLAKCKNLITSPRVKRLTHFQRFGRPPRGIVGDMIQELNPNAVWFNIGKGK